MPSPDLPPLLDRLTPEWFDSMAQGIHRLEQGFLAFPQKPGLDQMIDEKTWSIEGKAVAWLIQKITGVTSNVAGTLLHTPTAFLESPAFTGIYRQVVLMADAILLPAVAGYGLAVVLGWREDTEGVVKRLATAALVINAAPIGVRWLVEAGNALAAYVASGAAIAAPIVNDPRGAETGLILWVLVYLYLVMRVALQSARRTFGLVAWTALAPLVWMFSFLPGQAHRGSQWISKVVGLVIEQVAVAIEMALMVRLTMAPAIADVPAGQVILFQAGALLFATETPAIVQEWAATGGHPRDLGKAAMDLLTLRRLRQQVGTQVKPTGFLGGFLGRLGIVREGKIKWN